MERLVEVEQISFEEENNEVSLRPSSWDDYIGQEKIKKILGYLLMLLKKEEKHLTISYFMDLQDLEKQLYHI